MTPRPANLNEIGKDINELNNKFDSVIAGQISKLVFVSWFLIACFVVFGLTFLFGFSSVNPRIDQLEKSRQDQQDLNEMQSAFNEAVIKEIGINGK